MLRNKYYDEVQNDIFEMLKENYISNNIFDYIYKDSETCFVEFDNKFKERILEEAENSDGITGNASGSYFCNYYEAKECFFENDGNEILNASIEEGWIEKERIADFFLNDDYESLDVVCRFYACTQVIDNAVNDFEQYLNENEEELLKEIYVECGGCDNE